MPIVQIELLAGRTVEQKRTMARKVTDAIVESLNCPAEAIKVIIRDMPPENYASAGVLRVDQK